MNGDRLANGYQGLGWGDCGRGVQTKMGRGRTGLPVGAPKNASLCSPPPSTVPPGQASLRPTVPAPASCDLFFLNGPGPSPPLSLSPHRALGGLYPSRVDPASPGSPAALDPLSRGHWVTVLWLAAPPTSCSTCSFCPILFQPHRALGSWTNWPCVLLPLGLCTSCSIWNTHPRLSHLRLLSIKYPPVKALWGGH